MYALPKLKKVLRDPVVSVGLLAFAVFAIVVVIRSTGWLQWLELRAYDTFLRLRAVEQSGDPPIVIVSAGEDEVSRFGWPLPDSVLAEILDRLLDHDPEVIGVDIYRDQPVGSGTDRLHGILRAHEQIVWITKFSDTAASRVPPPEPLRGTERVGFADIIPDPDGTVRRALLFLDDGVTVEFSFGLILALRYLASRGVFPEPGQPDPSHIKLGPTTIPPFEAKDGGYIDADSSGYQFLLDFRKGEQAFPTIPLGEALDGNIEPDLIRGKIVLVGVMAQTVKDFFHTPFDSGSAQPTYGVALHSEVASQIIGHALEATPITRSLSEALELGWVLLWTILGALIAVWVRSPLWFAAAIVVAICGLTAATFAAFLAFWWIPFVPAALGTLGSAGLGTSYVSYRERRERAHLMSLFSRHVSGAVAEEIWRRRDEFLDEGRPKPTPLQATVLFVDIKDFTQIAEMLEPAILIDWLNSFFESMVRVVIGHGGVVDKFMGDAVMAVFGVPVPCQDANLIAEQARKAARCALAMGRELERLNAELGAAGLPLISVRIGIHTGGLVAGSLGSAERSEYTIVGDTVNTASRLESFADKIAKSEAKHTPCTIAISGATLRWLDDAFATQEIGEVQLKGKAERVSVYHLKDFAGPLGEAGDKS